MILVLDDFRIKINSYCLGSLPSARPGAQCLSVPSLAPHSHVVLVFSPLVKTSECLGPGVQTEAWGGKSAVNFG